MISSNVTAGREALIEMANQRISKGLNARIGEYILENNLAGTAVVLAGHADPQIAFRISWGLEYAYFKDRQYLSPFEDAIVDAYLNSGYDSTHRVYGKIVNDLLAQGSVAALEKSESIAEKAFDLLVCPKVKVAPKVWAMEILFILYERYDWLSENLAETIELQAALFPTPAMISHCNKILRRIHKRYKPV